MRAPLLPVTIAFAMGIVAGHFLSGTFVLVSAVVLTVLLLTLVSTVWWGVSGRAALVGALGLAALVGFWCVTVRERIVRADDISHIVKDEACLALRGTVVSRPEDRSYSTGITGDRIQRYTRFDMAVSEYQIGTDWHQASGRVRVSVREWTSKILPGDGLELFGKVYRPRGARNPGTFDYTRHLAGLGIRRCMSVRTAEAVSVIRHPGINIHTLGTLGASVRRLPVFNQPEHPENAGMLRCLLLGERYAVDPDVERCFRESGTLHLLAVSGLHVAVFLGTLWYCLRLMRLPERLIATVVIMAALGYAVVAGLRPSVVRAALVAIIFCGGFLIYRRASFLNSLSLAALILLAVNPSALFVAGFQLSFLAVVGIAAFAEPLSRWMLQFGGEYLHRLGAWDSPALRLRWTFNSAVVRAVSVSIGAIALVLPLSAYCFRNVTFLSPLFNIFMFPAIWLVLVTGFGAALLPVAPMLWASRLSVSVLLGLAETFSRMPGSVMYVPRPALWWVVCYYLLMVAVIFHRRLRLRLVYPLASSGLLVAGAFLWMGLRTPGRDELTVFDVGQGSAVVILTRDGSTLLYDLGSFNRGGVGSWIVAPYLLDRGVHCVDVLVLSHSDSDHVNGLRSLLEKIRVRRALLSPSFAWTVGGRKVIRILDDADVPIDFVRRGTRIRLSEQVQAEVLHPGTDDTFTRRLSINDTSVVLRVTSPAGCIQLWGDAETNVFKILVEKDENLSAQVVILPHHGSRVEPPMDRILPEWTNVIVSARESFVPRGRLKTLDAAGCEVFPTWRCGAITVMLDGKRPELRTFVEKK